jgi:uncharacterized protein involved in response to NO
MSTFPHAELPASFLRMLHAASHRVLFLVGAISMLLAMSWWDSWLLDTHGYPWQLPQPAAPAAWVQAIVMQYQVLPTFMFGLLFTVLPRWMNQPALTRWHYAPVGMGLLCGQLLTLAGLFGSALLLKLGAVMTLTGWCIGTAILARLVFRDAGKTWHAVSCLFALLCGAIGLLAYSTFLFLPGADGQLLFIAVRLGSMAVLLPICFTMCHRMIPFFARSTLTDYRMVRPMWALPVFWALALLDLWLELRHGNAWLWLPNAGLLALTLWHLLQWWPRRTVMPALLRVLFIGFAWLPLTFALYCTQALWYALGGEFVLGGAPAHAIFIGFLGSLLIAMVTGANPGRYGRPLALGKVAGFAFIVIQLVAALRVLAEVQADALAWHTSAGLGWLLAFLPWLLRSAWLQFTPRLHGKAG